jgi:hypothetical protein
MKARATKRKAEGAAVGADTRGSRSRSDSPTNVTCPMGSYASLFLKAPAPASSAKIPVPGVLQDALPPPPPPPLQEQEDNAPHLAAPLELHPTAPRSPKEEEYLAAGKVSYTQWRNERRKQGRRNVNMMLAHLDEILPKTFQSSPSPNGAGGRAVGAQGRSLHDVLNDTVRYLKHFKQEALHKAHGVERAEAVKGSLTSAKSVLCVEVEGGKGDSCTITGLGEGAKSFFKHSPWGDARGHSLAHFIRCEDLPAFHRLVDASQKPKSNKGMLGEATGDVGVPVRMMHFSRMAAVDEQGDDWPVKGRLSQSVFARLPSAFAYDPLLDPCPPQDLQDSSGNFTPDVVDPCNADAAVTCSYVPCSMQLHFVPLSEKGTEPGTPLEGPPSVSGEEDAAWKAVLVSPLNVSSGYTDRCSCCGGGGGTLGGCRRSAIMSLSPPIPVVAEPCAMPMYEAAPSHSWPVSGRSSLPMHSIAV